MEACVAIIACSMTAFPGLWNIVRSNGANLGPFARRRKNATQIDLPSNKRGQIPQVNFSSVTSGLNGMLMWDPFEERTNNDKDDHDMETWRNTSLKDDAVDSNATRRASCVEK